MEESLAQLLNHIQIHIDSFENEKLLKRNKNRKLGVAYTPNWIVDYIVTNTFRKYFHEILNSQNDYSDDLNISEQIKNLAKTKKDREKLIKIINNIRVLDPSCGSGRFLISVAEKLYDLYKIIVPEAPNFEIKNAIIKNNLFGIEIENSAIMVSKLRLIKWLLSSSLNNFHPINIKVLNLTNFNQIIEKLDIQFNIYNLDFLLEFSSEKFDIIIGNPPYIENKKINNIEFKKKITKRFSTAYRLFDLSIIFVERSLELLENNGYLSLLLPNKFLSADYGIKIRELLLNDSEIKEIINISSLSVFHNTATYPIILSLKKGKQCGEHEILIKTFNDMNELIENNGIKTIKFRQNLINDFPSKVIPISGNIKLITYLYKNFKTLAETFRDLILIYRPFGFLKYSKYFDNISDVYQSNNDLLLIGTGNIEKYHVKFNKRIIIAGKNIKISYFNYHSKFKHIWNNLNSEKIIFREIAKDLTCFYDPGVFTNITGLYFIKITSFDTTKLFALLAILNSQLLNSVFKALFSTLHMSGGYLRFNGSFIKRLPMPRKFPVFLSQLGKILQLLSQLKYHFDSDKPKIIKYPNLERLKKKYNNDIISHLRFFNSLSNSLVKLVFLDEFYLNSKFDYNVLRDLCDSEIEALKVPFKFIIPRTEIKNYKVYSLNELDSILTEISKLYNQLHNNIDLVNQLDHIMENKFS